MHEVPAVPLLPTHTLACEDRDFVAWHQGCQWCAVWVVELDLPALHARVDLARDALAPWLLPGYARQPHITVAYRGLMDTGEGHPAAEYGCADLQRDVAQLQQLPIDEEVAVQVQGVGSFDTVPYLALSDAGPLQQWHAALAPASPWPGWHYVPHVTLGHYAHTTALAPLLHRLTAAVGHAPALRCAVRTLSLVRYRSACIAGPLTVDGRFDLRTRCYTPQPGALLRP